MITIFIDFTKQEEAQADEIEAKYEKAFTTIEEIKNSRTDEQPEFLLYIEYPKKTTKAEFEQIKKENDTTNTANNEAYKKWEAAGSHEWREARKQWHITNDDYNNERSTLFKQAEKRQFKELGEDPTKILEDAKKQSIRVIYGLYQFLTRDGVKSRYVTDSRINKDYARDSITGCLHLHIEALKNNKKLSKELNSYIDGIIKRSEYVELSKGKDYSKGIISDILQIPNTNYPEIYITPKDKISNFLFKGNISQELEGLKMEKKGSKKQLTAMVSIDYDELKGDIQIKGRREFTPYDREVHDAIVSLYVDGGNEYLTPQMIYKTMTGNPNARLKPTQAKAISDSISKCMFSKLTIDAAKEAAAYGMDKLKYEGNLIYAEKVTGMSKGAVLEWIHILKAPILYQYADSKSQIGRFNIKLLNSPINKTEEIIMLQGYLSRRVLSMQGSSLSRNIVYDTVYKYIEVSAGSEGSLRNKKSKLRGQIKSIFDYWIKEHFIKSYVENKKGNEFYSISVDI